MKSFNTSAVCVPWKHYMSDISIKVSKLNDTIDSGKYLTISYSEQYGKTTILKTLQREHQEEYPVLYLSLSGISSSGFQTEGDFVQVVSRLISDQAEFFGVNIPKQVSEYIKMTCEKDSDTTEIRDLYKIFQIWSNVTGSILLIIDELEFIVNRPYFSDLLGLFVSDYDSREYVGTPAFRSVILSSRADIRQSKSETVNGDLSVIERFLDISIEPDLNINLSESDIKGMLNEYEADHHTGMDVAILSRKIRDCTNGHPYLISWICQLIDEKLGNETNLPDVWSVSGIEEAVRLIISEGDSSFCVSPERLYYLER